MFLLCAMEGDFVKHKNIEAAFAWSEINAVIFRKRVCKKLQRLLFLIVTNLRTGIKVESCKLNKH